MYSRANDPFFELEATMLKGEKCSKSVQTELQCLFYVSKDAFTATLLHLSLCGFCAYKMAAHVIIYYILYIIYYRWHYHVLVRKRET